MNRQRAILISGIWVAILPFLGFPSSWKTFFFFVTGAGLVYIAYKMNRERLALMYKKEEVIRLLPYTENKDEAMNRNSAETK